eukprot:TRINITY_DN10526_c0_g3_i3.p1 TRINITY_DN10526_c0_g3~~TRINITY_DN10526_c0_g3_i3.p1  ORF type:complete len:191 (+),score=28.27 TRINITY_DN10526_c0_g3_i3:97-669(+)
MECEGVKNSVKVANSEDTKEIQASKKVRIDSIEDLVKLSFTQIKELKMGDVRGRLFDQIFEDALYSGSTNYSNENTLISFNVKSIEFQVALKTEFGCEVCVLGSCERLGKWIANSAYSCLHLRYKMLWEEGHIWKASIPFPDLTGEFAYKYVVRDSRSKAVRKWEGGDNRIFNLKPVSYTHLTLPTSDLV